jgi:hypothetical protein
MYSDDRAVSVTVGYVLNFAMAALLISGVLVAGGGLIESQTKQVTTNELTVVGQQIADELSSADRLVRAGNVSTLSIRSDLPRRTAAGSYTINVTVDGNDGAIVLETSSPEVSVTVPFRIQSDLQADRIEGGPIRIEYDVANDRLRVVSA